MAINEGRVSKKKVLEVAKVATAKYGFCNEIKSVLAELGVEWVEGKYIFTVTIPESEFSDEYETETEEDMISAFRDIVNNTTYRERDGRSVYESVVPDDAISFVKHEK